MLKYSFAEYFCYDDYMVNKTKEKGNRKQNVKGLVVGFALILVLAILYATTDIELTLASLASDGLISFQLFLIFLPVLLLSILPTWFWLQLMNLKGAPLTVRIIMFTIIYVLVAGFSSILTFAAAWYPF